MGWVSSSGNVMWRELFMAVFPEPRCICLQALDVDCWRSVFCIMHLSSWHAFLSLCFF